MRARNIKPGFFDNEVIGSLSMTARILFIGLWCLADKNGIVEYRPQRIKIKLFPYDSLNLIKFLEEVSQAGLIIIWADKDLGGQFIEIPTFLRHQKPHPKEKASDLIDILRSSRNLIKLHENKCNSRLNVECGMLNVECGKGGMAKFDDFYSAYPKKKNRGAAEKAWNKIKPDSNLLKEMLSAISKQKESKDWRKDDGQFIPYPASWLNGKMWLDEVETDVDTSPVISAKDADTLALVRRL